MRRRKLLFFLLCIPSICLGQDTSEFNGSRWQSWSSDTRNSIVIGFMIGTAYVYQNTNFAGYPVEYNQSRASQVTSEIFDNKKKKYSPDDVLQVIELYGRGTNSTLGDFQILDISSSQIVAGLNELYSDFKNTQVHVSDAIYVVKKQITGASSQEVEAILHYVRGGKKDHSKRFYQEKDGQKKWASFP